MSLFSKSRLALAAVLGCTALALVAVPAFANRPAPAGSSVTGTGPSFAGIKPEKVEKGNAKVPEVKKKRAGGTHEVPNKDLLVKWFVDLNITHRVDDQGRVILPFRDDAAGLNLNLVLIPRIKPNGNMWAVQAVVPVQVPMPAGDAGLAKALVFANQWNNENFLIKASLMQPQGGQSFFLLDAALPCEDGISRGEFFQNFVGLLVQVSQMFVQKASAALAG